MFIDRYYEDKVESETKSGLPEKEIGKVDEKD